MTLRSLTVAVLVAAAGAVGVAPAAATTTSSRWHAAVRLGLPSEGAAPQMGGMTSVSCGAGGLCAAAGWDQNGPAGSSYDESMVALASAGRWARAQFLQMPSNAIALINAPTVSSVACAGRQCIAVGGYAYHGGDAAFITTESGGTWARATEVLPPANAATADQDSQLDAATCTGPGSCVALGSYIDRRSRYQMMAVVESSGRWRRAREIPSPAKAVQPGALPGAVSCWRAGGCTAVGSYPVSSGNYFPFAMTESHGRWRRPTTIARPRGAENIVPESGLSGVDCTGAGSCVAVGNYFDVAGDRPGMVVTERSGHWRRAIQVRGYADAFLLGISCTGAGSCQAIGNALTASGVSLPITVAESRGIWGRESDVGLPPGALLHGPQNAQLRSVACLTSGACYAVGSYSVKTSHRTIPMATERA